MKRLFKGLAVLLVIVSMVFVTGCGKDSKSIVGVWNYYNGSTTSKDIYYTFNKDNTGSYTYAGTARKFKYTDDGKKVTITYDGDTGSSEFEYSIEKNVLTIKDSFGSDVTYKRK